MFCDPSVLITKKPIPSVPVGITGAVAVFKLAPSVPKVREISPFFNKETPHFLYVEADWVYPTTSTPVVTTMSPVPLPDDGRQWWQDDNPKRRQLVELSYFPVSGLTTTELLYLKLSWLCWHHSSGGYLRINDLNGYRFVELASFPPVTAAS
jgi:hypothetical protein